MRHPFSIQASLIAGTVRRAGTSISTAGGP